MEVRLRRGRTLAVLVTCVSSWAHARARAQPAPAAPDAEVVTIEGTAPAESASSDHLDREELDERPHEQPSDLFRQIPGLLVAQHAGGGKADQWFIRGFDADHGTDVAVFVDGVPVNLPSHAHGQGYADTHWLIPETVDSIDVHKGPYAARFGDFYTAAAIETKTIDRVPGGAVVLGSFGVGLAGPEAFERPSARAVAMVSPELAGGGALFAAQAAYTDGAFVNPQQFGNGAALGKWSRRAGPGTLSLEATYYAARWNASGQIPASLVDSGALDRFGALDPSQGGRTTRASINAAYELRDAHDATWHAGAYVVDYHLRLFSNFTYWARDPVNGDAIEQDDDRVVYGADAFWLRPHRIGGATALLRAGVQARADDVDTALWHVASRQRLTDCFGAVNPCNADHDVILGLGVYAEEVIAPTPRVQLQAGARLDGFSWDVDDRSVQRLIANPKLSVVWHATDEIDVFANSGGGYHSNDARAAVATGGDGALARAIGAETGLRLHLGPHFHAAADVWYLHLSSEQVWNGDTGGTEAAGATERWGVDLETAADLTPWLSLDASLGIAHSAFVANAGNGLALALAPQLMGSGGVVAHRGAAFVSLRGRGIGPRPANDANTLIATGYFVLDLVAGARIGRWDLGLTFVNVLDSRWREAQFADTIATSPGVLAVEQIDFTPGSPATMFATVAASF
jgi:hypothetical protein